MHTRPARLVVRPAALCLAFIAAEADPAIAKDAASEPAWPRFRAQELHQDRNEGLAVADFNGDGRPDISAGA
ncbi:MAG: FG-GAP repeat protein, partial [Luteolibacter sp.]